MTNAISCDRDRLEFEGLPEYVREGDEPKKEIRNAMPAKSQDKGPRIFKDEDESDDQHNEILETLWPGVHQEFTQPSRRGPSFYLTIGFMAGAAMCMVMVWAYSFITSYIAATVGSPDKQIVVTQRAGKQQVVGNSKTATVPVAGDAILPLAAVYEVAEGDTLAGIALKNYKHVSPRLLDEICKANGMRNANVLSLGQKLNLPEYHRNSNQVAATSGGTAQ